MSDEKFWLDGSPQELINDFKLIPNKDDSLNSKLNTYTRILIIITVFLFCLGNEYWYAYALGGFLVIIAFAYFNKGKQGFAITPTYLSENVPQTTVAPLFAEEWQVTPTTYDLVDNFDEPKTFEEPLTPQQYPYGQYLTHINYLPQDEEASRTFMGSSNKAREYINSTFARNDIAFRENMTRIYKMKLKNRFKNSCNDSFSTYSSY